MIDWGPGQENGVGGVSESRPRGRHDDDDNWDPMGDASIRNNSSSSGMVMIGEKVANIPCPFQEESYQVCWKGHSCRYKHGKYTPSMKMAHPKLQDRSESTLLLAKNLPKQDILSEDIITLAWVTSVVNPSQFYIIPKNGSKCLCNSHNHHNQIGDFSQQRTCSGLDQLGILWRNMQNHYNNNLASTKEPCFQYFAGELVAVQVTLGDGGDGVINKGWFRAMVFDDTDPDLMDSDKAPCIYLKLLDYGCNLVKNMNDVTPLHEKFANDAPMALSCSLWGISPPTGRWSTQSKGTQFFNGLVTGQVVLVEVKAVQTDEDSTSLYTVSIYAKESGKFSPVARRMGDLGFGIEWNPTPTLTNSGILPLQGCDYVIKQTSESRMGPRTGKTEI